MLGKKKNIGEKESRNLFIYDWRFPKPGPSCSHKMSEGDNGGIYRRTFQQSTKVEKIEEAPASDGILVEFLLLPRERADGFTNKEIAAVQADRI